ncbi:MAG TPA: DUF5668 domain-containing protein [Candidatus Acidoferrales bacterium]|jgi:hypothetical protein|nr:DUF5668 domain-containing protein [Candidatus Acidoferrales bacterium]
MNGNGRSMVRAIRGPVTLITVGVLFALNNFTQYGFDKTWPVLLIVFGLLSLLRRGMEPVPPESTPPPYSYPPPPPGSGGYAGSSYTAPPQQPFPPAAGGSAKGGFGTSAPARPGDMGAGTGGAGTGSAGSGSAVTPGESL